MIDELIKQYLSFPAHAAQVNNNFQDKDILQVIPYISRKVSTVTFSANFLHYSYAQTSGYSDGDGGIDYTYGTTRYYYKATTGQYLAQAVSLLPSSVRRLIIEINNNIPSNRTQYDSINYNIDSLIKAVGVLSPLITHLDLSGVDLNDVYSSDITELFKHCPNTLKSIGFCISKDYKRISAALNSLHKSIEAIDLNNNLMFDVIAYARDEKYQLLGAIGRNVKHLRLKNNGIDKIPITDIPLVFNQLPPGLVSLDIGNNQLWQKGRDFLSTLLANLPPELAVLGLSHNEMFGSMSREDMQYVLRHIAATVDELDISDEGLLYIDEKELKRLLAVLPVTIKRLRMGEFNLQLNGHQLATKLNQLPYHIETFIISGNDLLGLPVREVVIGLQGLPETVHTLDLSDAGLDKKTGPELAELFAGLPPHIVKVILKRNGLASVDLAILKQGFEAMASTVVEIDLSENGFESLLRSQYNQFITFLPATIAQVILDANQFSIRNDGALMPYALPAHPGLFKPQHSIRLNQTFADLLIAWMQCFKAIDADVVVTHLILSFLLNDTKQQLHVKAQQLSAGLISVVPPNELTLSVQEKTCLVVQTRINDLIPQDSRLDLSRCGLNRITEADVFRGMLTKIPAPVQNLSLRANGFNYNKQSRSLFIAFLGTIPKTIRYLDLSGNGFEHFSADELEELFIYLPPTVELVSLGTEKPISPALQIQQRRWPKSYQSLTNETPVLMQKAQQLLNDYTQHNSRLKRILKGHWNRHHTKAVANIEYKIRLGAITNEEDLQQAFEEIPGIKPDGSLARRLSFLFHSETPPPKPAPTDNELIKALEDDPSTELSLHPH